MSYILEVTYSTDGAAHGAYLRGCDGNRVDFVYELDNAKTFSSRQEAQQFITDHPPLRTYRFELWRTA